MEELRRIEEQRDRRGAAKLAPRMGHLSQWVKARRNEKPGWVKVRKAIHGRKCLSFLLYMVTSLELNGFGCCFLRGGGGLGSPSKKPGLLLSGV